MLKLNKIFYVTFLLWTVVCGLWTVAFSQETFTITTYYPSPYGSYNDLYVANRLGIGTTAPSSKLHINETTIGNYALRVENSGGLQSNIAEFWSSGYGLQLRGNSYTRPAWFGNGTYMIFGDAFARMTSPGVSDVVFGGRIEAQQDAYFTSNVGIGTAGPLVPLHVSNLGSEGVLFTGDSSGAWRGIGFDVDNAGIQRIHADYGGGGVDSALVLGTFANRANQLYLDTTGNVGIGTQNPSTGLHLYGSGAAPQISLEENTSGERWILVPLNTGEFGIYEAGETYRLIIDDDNGNVGIGTPAPTTKLDVNGLIRVRNPAGDMNVPSRTNDGEFAFAVPLLSPARLYFQVNGSDVFINSSGAGDISEFFWKANKNDILEPGMLVAFRTDNLPSGVVLAQGGAGEKAIGVVSAGGTRNNDDQKDGMRHLDPNYVNVGILGHLPVKVSPENGAINPGDYLTSSPKGFAKRAIESGEVIGIALEPYDGKGKTAGTIMAYVNPQYWVNPDDFKNLNRKITELENKLKELKGQK